MSTQNACPNREMIFRLAHHLLDPAEESEARKHVLHCERCLQVAREFERFDAALEEWKEEGPSLGFDSRLRQKLPSAQPTRIFRLLALASTRIFAAAALVLVVVAGVYVVDLSPRQGKKPVGNVQVAKVNSPAMPQRPAPAIVASPARPLPPDQELKMYQNLGVLENLDMLENFDVLSELPKGNTSVEQ